MVSSPEVSYFEFRPVFSLETSHHLLEGGVQFFGCWLCFCLHVGDGAYCMCSLGEAVP